MRQADEHVGFSLIPSDRGVGDKKQFQTKIEIASNSIGGSASIRGVEMNKTVTKEVIFDEKPVRFEKNRLPYILALPIMWLLTLWVIIKKLVYRLLGKTGPKINSFWFDGLGLNCRKLKENAGGWKALDLIYNYQSCYGLIDKFWWRIQNCQALRNRFKLAKRELKKAILQFLNCEEEVRILSLACGSAQAVIELLAEFKNKGIIVKVVLVDIDQSALDYAMGLAEEYGVLNQIQLIKTNVSRVVKISREFKPQIIEMIGFLDYLPQKNAILLATKIRKSLEPNGIFITSNIVPNPEMYFAQWVVNWSVIYRFPIELAEIIKEAGFTNCRLIFEPLKIHCLAIAQKRV